MKTIIPEAQYDRVVKSFFFPRTMSVRINTLKTGREDFLSILKRKNIIFKEVPWIKEALVLDGVSPLELGAMDIVVEGLIYRQGLSSMLPVILLDPQPADCVLDMCAAPGSKATQIAACMSNQSKIVCIEPVRGRYYKLKSVALLMGAANMSFHLTDARRFRSRNQLFDKILVDAPCSSEGRFRAGDPKTFAYWSPRKIKEMVRKQRGLLLSASRLLRPGGTLVYSTCTFAPEENEGVVHWLLKKDGGTLETEKIHVPEVESYSIGTEWKGKVFNDQVKRILRVLPCEEMEGFFIAKFKKNH
ncbi:MAG: RsmB/NOP family class I SAM-dependent RNA methyltransferase [Candidatus Omnitrophica bacterium]|nr:RsmB/NOP family class I SAM-dependent RNA methyltransferase [Candidatus Omnitrophota bacterium]